MSVHYLVKLEMLVEDVLPLSCYIKKLQTHLWPPNSPDLNPADYSVWGLLQQMMFKTRITDLNKLKQQLRTECPKLDHVALK